MPRKRQQPKKPDTCPNCGYCEHCGRASAPAPQPVWVWPSYPPQYPWWTTPVQPTWWYAPASGTLIVDNTDIPVTGATVNIPSVWTNPNSGNGSDIQWSPTTS